MEAVVTGLYREFLLRDFAGNYVLDVESWYVP
jgi:hypothetical protein